MALRIEKRSGNLLLTYSPQGGIDYFNNHFDNFGSEESIGVKKIFQFIQSDLLDINYDREAKQITFILGKLENGYFRIRNEILGTEHDVLIHENCEITEKYFFVGNNSFLVELEKLSNQSVIIGGENINSIPEEIFINIVDSFPTKTELMHYGNAKDYKYIIRIFRMSYGFRK